MHGTLVHFFTLEWTLVTFADKRDESAKLGARRNVRSLDVPGRTVRGENLPWWDRAKAERGHREGGERLTEIDGYRERERERD